MTALASLNAAQHHDVWVVVGTLLAAAGLGILGLLLEPAARIRRRRNRRPAPPAQVALPQQPEAPTQRFPVYNVTTLQPRPVRRVDDDTAVFFRVLPEDPTVFIPRQRGARHAR